MKVKLSKLSVCPCGFTVLHDDIPLGTEYEIEPHKEQPFILICGNCKRRMSVNCVFVHERQDGGHAGYLPVDIFSRVTV